MAKTNRRHPSAYMRNAKARKAQDTRAFEDGCTEAELREWKRGGAAIEVE